MTEENIKTLEELQEEFQKQCDLLLVQAIKRQDFEAVIQNLNIGANPNAQVYEEKRMTRPLHEAVTIGNIPIIKHLLKKGANMNLLDGQNRLPEHRLSIDPKNLAAQTDLRAFLRAARANGVPKMCQSPDRATGFQLFWPPPGLSLS